jgi:predicted GH43/DUF377 family glycosyl hydrolase
MLLARVFSTVAVLMLFQASPAKAQEAEHPGFAKWLQPMDWKRDGDQPVFKIGEKGQFDDTHILSPSVIYEKGEYWLYYMGSTNDVIAKGLYKPATELTDDQEKRIRANEHKDRIYKIGLARSKDGVHFAKHEGNPVLSFGDDRRGLLTPNFLRHPDGSVLRENGKLVMYYTAADMPGDYKHVVHRSTSEDGIRWSAPSAPLLENAYAPYLMKEGETYKMWFTDVGKRPWVMRYAESKNGLKWTVDAKPAIQPKEQKWEGAGGDLVILPSVVYPSVFKVDDIYIALYGTFWESQHRTAIGLAVSTDGLSWRKFEGNPVFTPNPKNDWESNFTTSQTIMRLSDGSYRLWYGARQGPIPGSNPKNPSWAVLYYAVGTAHWDGPK